MRGLADFYHELFLFVIYVTLSPAKYFFLFGSGSSGLWTVKGSATVLTFPGIGVIFEPGGIMASWQPRKISADVAVPLDCRIDRLVYDLYGLTQKEIALVEKEI